MYSMVLLMALNTGAATPATFFGHGCHGCYGCNGCHGGYKVSHGCHGGYSCHGCHGCRGGFIFGLFRHGCHGCHGGYACHGGNGCHGCHGGCNGGGVIIEKKDAPPADAGDGAKTGAISAPARLIVTLPEDAKLTVDGRPTASTASTRTFSTPALQSGKAYYYTLKAEVVRNGKTESTTERVAVQAGQETRISLVLPEAVTASK